jgi:hypothetical protein
MQFNGQRREPAVHRAVHSGFTIGTESATVSMPDS